MADPLSGFITLLVGNGQHQQARDQVDGVQQGVVLSVDGDSARVTLDAFGDKYAFGPLYFGRTETPPEVGDICLVAFVGKDVKTGWLLRWREP